MSKKKKNEPIQIMYATNDILRTQFGLTFKILLHKSYLNCKLPETSHCGNAAYGKNLLDYYNGFCEANNNSIQPNRQEIEEALKIISHRNFKNKNNGGMKFNLQNLQNKNYPFKKRKKWINKTYKIIKKHAPEGININNKNETYPLMIFASSISSCYLCKIPGHKFSSSKDQYNGFIKLQEDQFKSKHS